MGKRLIIAEKPSVGRDIAKVLNCSKKQYEIIKALMNEIKKEGI